jgi:hypothetical protein
MDVPANCDTFLIVRFFLGSVFMCFEVSRHDRKALWAEPTDVVGVTCWAALEMKSVHGSHVAAASS